MRSFKFLIKAIVFLLCTGSLFAQNAPEITKLEYYIDIDPGYGLGIQISISPDSTVNIFETIDLSTTTLGFHLLGIRAMDENGVWGTTHTHRFHVADKSFTEPSTDVVEVEYFFNTDDGYGEGISLTITPDSMLHIMPLIDLSSATPGFNLLGIRAKDAEGHWGTTHTHRFHVDDVMHTSLSNIVEIEYFFNDPDPGIGLGFTIPTTPDIYVDTSLIIDLTSLAIWPSFMGIRAKDDEGSYSHTYIHYFEMIYPPDTFDFTGGNSYCAGQPGVTATLSSSESNVFYVLYKDALPFDTLNGTGSPLVWNNLYYGTYNVMGHFIDTAHVYTYMNGVLTVVENPLPIVSCPADFDVCNSVDSLALLGATPVGGTYSGTGVSNGYFYPAQLTADDYDITYVYQDLNGCIDSCTFTITVNALPAITCPMDFALCLDADSVLLAGGLPAGGTYSGTGINNGYFNPVVALPGNHIITYTYTDGNMCTNTCTFTITVHDMPVVSTGGPLTLCVDGDSVLLTGGLPAGGSYSGTGVNNGYFNPQIGAGSYAITYTFVDTNGCEGVSIFDIDVFNVPVITFTNNSPVCQGETISITALGGTSYTWTGPGGYTHNTASVSIINADLANAGNYTVVVGNANGCIADTTVVVVVNTLPTVSISATETSVCNGQTTELTATGSADVTTYAWSTTATTSQITVTPVVPSSAYTITVSTAQSCSNTADISIVVNNNPAVELTGTPESCEDKADGRIDVSITNPTVKPYSYLWYYGANAIDSGVTDVTSFYLSNAASGDYTLMLEDAFGCAATANYFLEPSTLSCHKGALVPDIFSPNGDGINDILYVYGQYIESVEFVIYSRWGHKLFESTNINHGWDGKHNGKDVPQGVYAYILKVVYQDNTSEEISGDVTLIK